MLAPLAFALLVAAADPAAAAVAPSPLPVAPLPGQPNLLGLNLPAIPPELAARLEQYLNARAATLLDVSPDGEAVLVATRFGSTAQVHLVTRPLGMREQLTFGKEPVLAARFVPGDPATLLYLQDAGGGESYQLYRLDRRTGRSERLTDGKSRHEGLVVARDGKRFAYSGTGRNGKDSDVFVAETARPREARRLSEREGTFEPLGFSPDGRRLLVRQFRAISDADLLLLDVATGETRALLAGKGSLADAAFAADGRSVYAITNRFGDWNALQRVDLAVPGASPRPVGPAIRADLEGLAVAADGKVAFTVNQDGSSRLRLLDPATGRTTELPLPRGVAGAPHFPAGRSDRLAISVTTPTAPSDAYVLDLRGGKAERWTRSEVGGLDPARFVAPELVHYASADGVTVPAFLYRPRGATGRLPVVVGWHGGPEAQHRPLFSPLYQYLAVELGCAVLLPNVRGSDGYGKAFLALDDGVRREAALADIGATLDFVASRPDLDASRVAVYGGSYGGFMVLASAALHPERIRAAVDIVGISSIPTFLESTQAYRRDLRRAEYGDERIPEVRAVQERISPLRQVDRIITPLLVIQGKNDPRVPQTEAEQLVRAVQAKGSDVWYLLALDEGHGFQKKENRDTMTALVVLFLERTLSVKATPAR